MVVKEYRKEVSKRMKNDKFMNILGFYILSLFQDFENHLRTEIVLIEDNIRLVLDEYNSSFITYEVKRGIYTFKDLSEALFELLRPEYEKFNNSIDINFDDITVEN